MWTWVIKKHYQEVPHEVIHGVIYESEIEAENALRAILKNDEVYFAYAVIERRAYVNQ
jgi:hypothetical protein